MSRAREAAAHVAEAVAKAYPAEKVHTVAASTQASEDAPLESLAENLSVHRMFSRLGLVSRREVRNSRLLKRIIDQMGESSGYTAETAAAALRLYAEGDAELGVEGICTEVPRCDACPLSRDCRFRKGRLTMHDIPEEERPRERLLRDGPEALSNAELLAIILRSGSTQETALQLGERLLSTFGSLRALAEATAGELRSIGGVGPAKAAQVLAALNISKRLWAQDATAENAITSSREAYQFFRSKLDGRKQETFVALLLDVKKRPMKYVVISQGSLTESLVHPREAFRPALRESADAVIFAHNHPSGDASPSGEDLTITRRLAEAGRLLGIEVLDHIIVGASSYISMADMGALSP